MTPLALTFDAVAAIAAVGLAAAFLVARGVRTLGRRGAGGCGCEASSKKGGCGAAGGPSSDDLRAAAARGAKRAGDSSAR